MRKLIEITHVSLGGEVGTIDEWVFPYFGEEHKAYAAPQLREADCLLLGRVTYEGLSAAYPTMSGGVGQVPSCRDFPNARPIFERIGEPPALIGPTGIARSVRPDMASTIGFRPTRNPVPVAPVGHEDRSASPDISPPGTP